MRWVNTWQGSCSKNANFYVSFSQVIKDENDVYPGKNFENAGHTTEFHFPSRLPHGGAVILPHHHEVSDRDLVKFKTWQKY
jgi:hypothetical protein